jgi:hypothetical protein
VLSSGCTAFSWSVSSVAIRPKAPPLKGSMMIPSCLQKYDYFAKLYEETTDIFIKNL